jgi:hypothetical protein
MAPFLRSEKARGLNFKSLNLKAKLRVRRLAPQTELATEGKRPVFKYLLGKGLAATC